MGGVISLIHAPFPLLTEMLLHFRQQKLRHGNAGCIVVVPHDCLPRLREELNGFKLSHNVHRNAYVFVSGVTGKRVSARKSYAVFVDLPHEPTAVTASGLVADEPIFNLPATVAGGPGVVTCSTHALVDIRWIRGVLLLKP